MGCPGPRSAAPWGVRSEVGQGDTIFKNTCKTVRIYRNGRDHHPLSATRPGVPGQEGERQVLIRAVSGHHKWRWHQPVGFIDVDDKPHVVQKPSVKPRGSPTFLGRIEDAVKEAQFVVASTEQPFVADYINVLGDDGEVVRQWEFYKAP